GLLEAGTGSEREGETDDEDGYEVVAIAEVADDVGKRPAGLVALDDPPEGVARGLRAGGTHAEGDEEAVLAREGLSGDEPDDARDDGSGGEGDGEADEEAGRLDAAR